MPLKRALSKERKKTMTKSNELREKIKKVLKRPILTGSKCPYCDFERNDHRQVIHHLISMHREKYDEKYSREAQLTALYKQEIALKIEEIEGLMEGMMPLNEEVNFEEDNEAGIKREVLLDLLASLKQNK